MHSTEALKEKCHEIYCKLSEGDLAAAEIIANGLKFQYPEEVLALEARASVCVDLLNLDEARTLLNSAIEKSPNTGFDKYLMRGELRENQEAIADYQKAIELIERDIADNKETEIVSASYGSSDVVEDSLPRKLCRAYCSLATEHSVIATEGLEKGAEVPVVEEFLSAMQKAKEADSTYVEVYTLMASYEITKDNLPAAAEILEASRHHWHPEQCEDFLNWDQGIKITLAQVLSDVKMYGDAEIVLIENLESMEEDRESLELLADLYFERGDPEDFERAKIYCRQAIQSTQREGSGSSGDDTARLEADYDRLMELYYGINKELGLEVDDGLADDDDEEDSDADDEEIERELMEELCLEEEEDGMEQ